MQNGVSDRDWQYCYTLILYCYTILFGPRLARLLYSYTILLHYTVRTATSTKSGSNVSAPTACRHATRSRRQSSGGRRAAEAVAGWRGGAYTIVQYSVIGRDGAHVWHSTYDIVQYSALQCPIMYTVHDRSESKNRPMERMHNKV